MDQEADPAAKTGLAVVNHLELVLMVAVTLGLVHAQSVNRDLREELLSGDLMDWCRHGIFC